MANFNMAPGRGENLTNQVSTFFFQISPEIIQMLLT